MRTKIINVAVFCVFLLLIFHLLNLQVIKSGQFRELSYKNCIRLMPQSGSRGRILDREGNVIAGNQLYYDVMILPQRKANIDELLLKVAGILEVDFRNLKDAFDRGFIAPFTPITLARNIEIKKAIALEELKSELNGVIIQPRPQRAYPYGKLACHLLGYLNEIDRWRLTKLADYGYKTKDIVGFGGIEEKYDYYLRQEEGGLLVEVDHRGRFVRVLGFKPPKSGKDIQLTLDLKIQKIVEKNLADRKGCVIVMDPYSGEIIAMASRPDFNPSVFIKKTTASLQEVFNNPDAPLINRVISGTYPAGSVFKLIVATAALETGKINLSQTFFCPGSAQIGRQKFACWDTHHYENLMDAITHSCNVFFYRTGILVGAQSIHDHALKFGFGRTASIELPYEESGFVPSPLWRKIYRFKNWFDGDTANLSIGQGELLVTPLQIARMMAVFANKGRLVTPYIVKAIDGQDISSGQKKITALAIKGTTVDSIRQGLRNVVADPSGTANVLSQLSVAVSGKTGTAQAPPGQSHGWFAGFLPYNNPKFVICVFLERGGPGYASCVLARQIIEEMIEGGLL